MYFRLRDSAEIDQGTICSLLQLFRSRKQQNNLATLLFVKSDQLLP